MSSAIVIVIGTVHTYSSSRKERIFSSRCLRRPGGRALYRTIPRPVGSRRAVPDVSRADIVIVPHEIKVVRDADRHIETESGGDTNSGGSSMATGGAIGAIGTGAETTSLGGLPMLILKSTPTLPCTRQRGRTDKQHGRQQNLFFHVRSPLVGGNCEEFRYT